jgi:hypothetical protein
MPLDDDSGAVPSPSIDSRPAVVARCARRDSCWVAVLPGEHSVAGMAVNDGGLVAMAAP